MDDEGTSKGSIELTGVVWTVADLAAEAGVTYWYKVEVVYPDGKSEVWDRAVSASLLVPARLALRLTGPHPIRLARGSEIAYDVPMPGADVSMALYDISGRRVATLAEGHVGPGSHVATLAGPGLERLGSGAYFLRMEAGSFRETKRVVVLR